MKLPAAMQEYAFLVGAGLLGLLLMAQACLGAGQPLSHAARAAVPAAALLAVAWGLNAAGERRDHFLLAPMAFLCTLGVTVLWTVDGYLAAKQVVWCGLGAMTIAAIYLMVESTSSLARLGWVAGFVAIGLFLATMAWGIERNGVRLWLGIPGVAMFQAGELGRLLLVVFLAALLSRPRQQRSLLAYLSVLLALAVATGVLLFQRDFGAAAVLLAVALGMVYIASGLTAWIWAGAGAFVALASLAALQAPAVAEHLHGVVARRILAWVDPWAEPRGAGWQCLQALYGMAHGGLLGTGLGAGTPRAIPVAESDMIYAALSHQLGMVGGISALLAMALLFWRGMTLASCAPSAFDRLLASGVSLLLCCQALVAVAGNLRLLPITGMTFPWLGYGGTSMVVASAAVGLLLCASRECRYARGA